MATGNMLLGLSRKKLGDLVFYVSDGQQRTRVRRRSIANPRTAKQAVQRMVLATSSKTLAALRGIYDHSFESVAVGTPSLRHAQRLLMAGYRSRAAAYLNEETIAGNQAIFALKGAPIAGCYAGMPITQGRLSFVNVGVTTESIGNVNVDGLQIANLTSAFTGTISTQEQYIAALAELGIEPGDQLTFVVYAGNPEVIVAESGSQSNFADMYRYARVTFVTELPENFSGTIIDNDTINAALIASQEGVLPAMSVSNGAMFISFINVLPSGYVFFAGTIIRSQKQANGATYYSNASMLTDMQAWDENLAGYYTSYMDGADEVNVGSNLYLKNAELSSF